MENSLRLPDERYSVRIENDLRIEDFDNWIRSLDIGSERTADTYKKNITRFIEYLQLNGIDRPTQRDIIAYRDYLKETKKPTTVQGYMAAIKLFFKWTDDMHLYPDVAKNVKGVNVPITHKKDPFTVNQIKEILNSIDRTNLMGLRDYAMILLMVTTGLREISVSLADIGDIHAQAFDQGAEVDYKTVLYYKGKGHQEKDLLVRIPPVTKYAIDAYLKERQKKGGSVKGDCPLFTSLSKHNMDSRLTTRSIRRICVNHFNETDIDMSRLSTHSLRHSFATINILQGGSLEETQKALGHAQITTTMIYNQAITDANNQSEKRVADAIFSD